VPNYPEKGRHWDPKGYPGCPITREKQRVLGIHKKRNNHYM
jgi:hypothetical protein